MCLTWIAQKQQKIYEIMQTVKLLCFQGLYCEKDRLNRELRRLLLFFFNENLISLSAYLLWYDGGISYVRSIMIKQWNKQRVMRRDISMTQSSHYDIFIAIFRGPLEFLLSACENYCRGGVLNKIANFAWAQKIRWRKIKAVRFLIKLRL